MEATEFLTQFASTTGAMVESVGLPLFYIIFAIAFVLIVLGWIYKSTSKGVKNALRR